MTKDLFCSQSEHELAASAFASVLKKTNGTVRLAKKTSNLFRKRDEAKRGFSVSSFARTIFVDLVNGYADVQGMCTFEDFTDACLAYGCFPAVVPELKTITVGGAVSGVGIEATSFKHGFAHEAVLEMEVLCGDGEIRVCRADNEFSDLFFAIPNSYGSLGYILRLRYKILPARYSVKAIYTRFCDRIAFLQAMKDACSSSADFVEGVCFAPSRYTLAVAKLCDEKPNANIFGIRPYYKRLQNKSGTTLSMRDWLWRWDADWFWCSRFYGMENPILRFIGSLGEPPFMLQSKRYWKILSWWRRNEMEKKLNVLRKKFNKPEHFAEFVIQDVEIPFEKCLEFLDFYEENIKIHPFWVCPIIPQKDANKWSLYSMEPGELHLNFGFWHTVPTSKNTPQGFVNRKLEQEVAKLGGRKSLYSDCYFPEDEFWQIYNGDFYKKIKNKYDPNSRFANLYVKISTFKL
jgi:FAD/FMN-containing dehydrogenase